MNSVLTAPQLVEKSRNHINEKSTDKWETTMEIPVSEYLEHRIWQREVDALFLRRPQILAFTCELKNPGDYRALNLAGVPLLVTRGKDGQARAFVNACRHRGTQIVDEGCGHASRFSCPYHAWTYDTTGKLIGVYDEKNFGTVDRAERSLTPLACVEKAGMIWGVLTPGIEMDLDEWLGDYAGVLEDLHLEDWHIAQRRELAGPNWKIVFDGYLEGYHFSVLHKPSVAKDTKGTMVAEQFGPHQRLIFARENMNKVMPGDPELGAADSIFPVHSVYPNVSFAGGYLDQILYSQIMPGATPEESITYVTLLSREPMNDPEQKLRMDKYADYIFAVLRDEDFAAGIRIQATLNSGGNESFIIGRNELTLQHFHNWLRRHRAEELPQKGDCVGL